MKYNGIELVDIADTPQFVNPPRLMLVWDNDNDTVIKMLTHAIVPFTTDKLRVITENEDGAAVRYAHCAEIPEEPKKRATNRQLAKWLAQGNGESKAICSGAYARTSYAYSGEDDGELEMELRIRKWDDTEWHEPTLKYMGLDG